MMLAVSCYWYGVIVSMTVSRKMVKIGILSTIMAQKTYGLFWNPILLFSFFGTKHDAIMMSNNVRKQKVRKLYLDSAEQGSGRALKPFLQ